MDICIYVYIYKYIYIYIYMYIYVYIYIYIERERGCDLIGCRELGLELLNLFLEGLCLLQDLWFRLQGSGFRV